VFHGLKPVATISVIPTEFLRVAMVGVLVVAVRFCIIVVIMKSGFAAFSFFWWRSHQKRGLYFCLCGCLFCVLGCLFYAYVLFIYKMG
jgi:hypothetical protein